MFSVVILTARHPVFSLVFRSMSRCVRPSAGGSRCPARLASICSLIRSVPVPELPIHPSATSCANVVLSRYLGHCSVRESDCALLAAAPGKPGLVDAEPVEESVGVVPDQVAFVCAAFRQSLDEGSILLFRAMGLCPAVQGVTRKAGHLHRQPERVASLPREAPDRTAYLNWRLGLQELLDHLGQLGPQGEQY